MKNTGQRLIPALVISLAVIAPFLHAQRITRLHATIELRRDGSALISEETTVRGSSFLRRSIPLRLATAEKSWDRDIKLLSVLDSSARPLPYQATVRQEHLIITAPLPALPADAATVLLTYEVQRSIVVYWEAKIAWFEFAFADDQHWPVPFDEVVVTAIVPEDPHGGLEAYLNNAGEPSTVAYHGRTARATRLNVARGYWVTFSVGFPSSMVSLPWQEWLNQEAVRTFLGMLFLLGLCGAYVYYQHSVASADHARRDYSRVVIPPPCRPDELDTSKNPGQSASEPSTRSRTFRL